MDFSHCAFCGAPRHPASGMLVGSPVEFPACSRCFRELVEQMKEALSREIHVSTRAREVYKAVPKAERGRRPGILFYEFADTSIGAKRRNPDDLQLIFANDEESELVTDPWQFAADHGVTVLSHLDWYGGYVDDQGVLVAVLFTGRSGDNYDFDIVVAPEARRRGLAGQLMDMAIDEYEELREPLPDLVLSLDVINPISRKMLEARGFRVVGGTEDRPQMSRNPEDLGEVEVVENGVFFASGVPVTFPYLHNTEVSPYFGAKFGQDIEPAGFFLLTDTADAARHPLPGWVYGNITLDSPLVLALQTDESRGIDYYGPSGWKNRLYRAYGLTGIDLSRALLADGYDSVVTVKLRDGVPEYTSEIVDLRVVEEI